MKKTISAWEKNKNWVITDPKVDVTKQVTEEEFDELRTKLEKDNLIVGVDHEVRAEYLKANGHKVTRENLVDTSL